MSHQRTTTEQAHHLLVRDGVSEFPLESLSELYQATIIELYQNANYNIDYTATSIFLASAVAIGSKIRLERNMEWIEYPVFWFAIVGKSGQNKSAPIKTAFRAAQLKQDKFTESYNAQVQNYNPENKDPFPIQRKILTTEATYESIIKILEENPHGIVIKPDEFKSFITNLTGYSGGSKQAQYLSMWDGSSISLDRKRAVSSYVKKPLVSVIGGIQDDVIAYLKAKDIKDGFFERILYTIPKKMEKRKQPRTPLNHQLITKYHKFTSDFLNFYLEKQQTQTIKLSKQAELLFIDELDSHVEPSNKDSSVSGILAKLERYMLRFAIVIEANEAYSKHQDVVEVSKESMRKSILLKNYFFKNALTLNNMTLEIFESNSKEGKVLKILKAMGKKEFSHTDFIQMANRLNIAKESYAYRLLSQTKLIEKLSRGKYITELIE